MVKDPAVTVITATYNAADTLRLALCSVLQQSFADFEVWVIGDACTDHSAAVIEALGDPRLHWKNLERNHGSQAFPNNEGLRLARGRYIAYLGHDDLWFPDHLGGLVEQLERQKADLAHALCALIGPEGFRAMIGPAKPGRAYGRHFVPPSTWLHRRDLIERIGPWRDPDQLAWAVDFDVLKRMDWAGLAFAYIPQLSVLKFPSPWFGSYARKGPAPQLPWWERLQQDPQRLEYEVLKSAATVLAQLQYGGDPPLRGVTLEPLRVAKRRFVDAFGNQGPLQPILRAYFQWHRRRQKRKRGLK